MIPVIQTDMNTVPRLCRRILYPFIRRIMNCKQEEYIINRGKEDIMSLRVKVEGSYMDMN